eukprot:TRINITY_DN1536_c0_g1_i3.p1 TRINITY_DN1536_c0_g1~~TRINITY_DN1536_c0_g1_i3.p1  ORF type:complete len:252 (-),score=45.56 TRINITY_DN1536_c0_g1_i3:431-1186(-)
MASKDDYESRTASSVVYEYDVESIQKTNVSTMAPEVRSHLLRVYSLLSVTTIASIVGAYLSLNYLILHPLVFLIPILLCVAHITWRPEVTENDNLTSHEKYMRLGVLLLFGFFEGCSLARLIDISLKINPANLMIAFLGTLVVFGCLSGSALLARRKSYLFVGGFLSSALINLFYLGILNIFLGVEFLDSVYLYGGLVVFSGFVLYDTQMMFEKLHRGSRDDVRHAMELYLDLIAIFIRILVILSKKDRRK